MVCTCSFTGQGAIAQKHVMRSSGSIAGLSPGKKGLVTIERFLGCVESAVSILNKLIK